MINVSQIIMDTQIRAVNVSSALIRQIAKFTHDD